MLEMLKQTGRSEMVVGWYHSHPGFGCWMSGVDMNTQTSFEQLNARAVSLPSDESSCRCLVERGHGCSRRVVVL
jgi:26S proteasome regulatory subunit N11